MEDKEPLLGSNLISNALRQKNAATGKTVKAACCWKHYRRYFTVADYRESPKEKQKSGPLWKVRELLDELKSKQRTCGCQGNGSPLTSRRWGFKADRE